MTDARKLHSRVDNLSKTKKEPGQADTTVPVTFDPYVPKHESFADFYPLHVTKVAKDKPVNWLPWLVGLVALIAVSFLAVWYITMQEPAPENKPDSQIPTSVTNPDGNNAATDQTGGVDTGP